MSEKEVFLTQEGLEKLEEELEHLKVVRRREIAEKIKVALDFGDISENSEYDEAKTEQAQLEERILKLENMIRNASIIDESELSKDKVSLGGRVLVKDLEFDDEMEFTIVGSAETDPLKGRISNESPLGKALLGRAPGETVEVQAPDGVVLKYDIIEIIG